MTQDYDFSELVRASRKYKSDKEAKYKDSSRDRLSKIAKKKIEKGHNFGMSHLKIGTRLIRTPLGGFLNHADDANCFKTKLLYTNEDDPKIKMDYKVWNLISIKDIKEGEELTVTYTFYKIDA